MVFYFYSILLDRHPVFLLRLGSVGVGLQGVTDTCCQSHTNKGMNLRVAPLVVAGVGWRRRRRRSLDTAGVTVRAAGGAS